MQEALRKTVHILYNDLCKWMAKFCLGKIINMKNLLRHINEKKLWRPTIVSVMKEKGT